MALSFVTANAQTGTFNFSTSYKQECYWNSTLEKYDNCSGSTQVSLFTLNPDQTMFHHTTSTISSDYYVISKECDDNVCVYDVKSDVGNNYYFIIDLKNNQIRIVKNNKDNTKTYMIIHTIKRYWVE